MRKFSQLRASPRKVRAEFAQVRAEFAQVRASSRKFAQSSRRFRASMHQFAQISRRVHAPIICDNLSYNAVDQSKNKTRPNAKAVEPFRPVLGVYIYVNVYIFYEFYNFYKTF
jgi:hypothetical protein